MRPTGQCNLCERVRPLSEDHVPPKGSYLPRQVHVQSPLQQLVGRADDIRRKILQNGLTFRNICGDCNAMIGRLYDPVLNALSRRIGSILATQLVLPPVVHVKTKPNSLSRAILGHLVASIPHGDSTSFDKAVRPSILDTTGALPSDLYLFYWAYPFTTQKLIRDIVMPITTGARKTDVRVFHLIKYFPMVYLVTDCPRISGLADLHGTWQAGCDDEIDVSIRLRRFPPEHWPETPRYCGFVMGGRNLERASVADPRFIQ